MILQFNTMILHDKRKKSLYSFLRSLVKGQDHSFFKDLTGLFCIVGCTLVFFRYCNIWNVQAFSHPIFLVTGRRGGGDNN
jgi:hypothetical protein